MAGNLLMETFESEEAVSMMCERVFLNYASLWCLSYESRVEKSTEHWSTGKTL